MLGGLKEKNLEMDYAVHNVPSYQNMMGTEQRAHMGSQCGNGTQGINLSVPGSAGPVSGTGAKEQIPGGATDVASHRAAVSS